MEKNATVKSKISKKNNILIYFFMSFLNWYENIAKNRLKKKNSIGMAFIIITSLILISSFRISEKIKYGIQNEND